MVRAIEFAAVALDRTGIIVLSVVRRRVRRSIFYPVSAVSPRISRRKFVTKVIAGSSALYGTSRVAGADVSSDERRDPPRRAPGKAWERVSPAAAGFDPALFNQLEEKLYSWPTTALLVVRGGKVAYSYGDVAQVSYLASARKSVLSLLYGKYVANGTIDLQRTLADLGIDDDGGLLPIEKTATIRDLLISSSGVYHPAGSPGSGSDMPPRGSKKPGTFFCYNNWDFNVAGTVFEQLTGQTVFEALADDLAGPLGFEDFDPARQRMLGFEPRRSRHLAYHLFLSGRDMARLGVMALNRGGWHGGQIVPENWMRESTKPQVANTAASGQPPVGYGYLWWLPRSDKAPEKWQGAFQATGNYGQYILGLPAIDTVIVHRRAVSDEFAIARNHGRTSATPAGGGADFRAIAEAVVNAAT